jgi:hypothetical protein
VVGKGVLLELQGRQAVVLTPQGEFIRVPAPGGSLEIGDEIEFAETRSTPWAKWGLVAAAAVVLLVAPAGYQTYALAQPVAIVTVDINPSVQLTLNKKDQVLKVDALNQDGSLVLNGLEYRRQPVGEVVAEIAAKAVEVQKLNVADDAGAVVVAVAPVNAKDLPKTQADRIRDAAYSAVTTVVQATAKEKGVEPKANVLAVEATAAEKAEAQQIGISPGKLITGKEIQQVAPQVRLEDLKDVGPGKLLKNLNINPGEVFGQAEKAHEGKSNNGNGKSQGSGSEQPQQTQPAVAQPSQQPTQPGKSDDKGKDDKNDDKQPGQGNGQSGKDDGKQNEHNPPGQSKDQPGKGSTIAPGTNDSKGQSNKENNSDSKGNGKEKKDDQSKGSEKKGSDHSGSNTWNFFGWTIEKPAFLRGSDAAPAVPEQNPPQASAPGVGAPPETASGPGTSSPAPAAAAPSPSGSEQDSHADQNQGHGNGNANGNGNGQDKQDNNGKKENGKH